MCVLAVITEDVEDWIIIYKSLLSHLMELYVHILAMWLCCAFQSSCEDNMKVCVSVCVYVCVCVHI